MKSHEAFFEEKKRKARFERGVGGTFWRKQKFPLQKKLQIAITC